MLPRRPSVGIRQRVKVLLKKTVTRSSVMSTGQSSHVLQGLKDLKDLQQQSPSSMNDMISTMKSAMETFT